MMSDALFHFSENPHIETFVPRVGASRPDLGAVVWAIDTIHSPLYFFPRDCPRIAFWQLPTSTLEDTERFLGYTAAPMVLTIESAWLERMQSTVLYVYRFAADVFEPLHDHGCHLARQTVSPFGPPEPVGNLLARLCDAGVELRLTPSLWPLHDALLSATLHYSMIRMRNAAPRGKDNQ